MKQILFFSAVLVFTFFNSVFAQTTPPQNSQTENTQSRPRVGNINPADKDKYRVRYEAKDNRTFSFGAARGIHLNNEDILYTVIMGYDWEVGATGSIPAEAFTVLGNSTFYGDIGLGYKHFFSDEDFSPFIKATVGAGAVTLKNLESVNGFSFRSTIGATFFRTSTKHLELAASYGAILKDTSMGFPHVFTFTIGVLY